MKRIALFLIRQDEAQRSWLAEAQAEASRLGIEIKEYWGEDSAQQQIRQISECIFQDLAEALIVMPISLGGPAALLLQAVTRSKPIVLLNRTINDMNQDVAWSLPRLRREHPGVLSARVAPDEIEIGRIQGRQIRSLLPAGGTVLYVQGDMMTSGAVDRTTGMEEVLASDASYLVSKIDGRWSETHADVVAYDWMRLAHADARFHLDLICSQSEMMLPGIRAALSRFATEAGRPDLTRVPLTGCDGWPTYKQEVSEGLLAATIEIPERIAPAVRLIAEFWNMGALPPTPEVMLSPTSFPPLDRLARIH